MRAATSNISRHCHKRRDIILRHKRRDIILHPSVIHCRPRRRMQQIQWVLIWQVPVYHLTGERITGRGITTSIDTPFWTLVWGRKLPGYVVHRAETLGRRRRGKRTPYLACTDTAPGTTHKHTLHWRGRREVCSGRALPGRGCTVSWRGCGSVFWTPISGWPSTKFRPRWSSTEAEG